MKHVGVLVAIGSLATAVVANAQQPDTTRAKGDSSRRLLPPIVVTATRTPKTQFAAPSPVSYIGNDVIRERMPNSISELFRDLPGLDVEGVGTNQVRPSIRGQSGQRILLVEDGIRMNNSRRQENFGELPSLVGLADIDRVEVVRGPSSVLYGTDAIAGVVNIITKDVPVYADASMHGRLSFQYGSADLQKTPTAVLEQRTGPFAYRLSATTRQSRSYDAPAGTYGNVTLASRQRVNDSGVDDKSFSTSLSYDVSPTQRITAKWEQYVARDAGFGYIDPSIIGPNEPLIRIRYPDQHVDKYTMRYDASALPLAIADRLHVTTYTVRNTRDLTMNVFVPFGPGTPPGAGVQVGSANFTDLSTLGVRAEATKRVGAHVFTYGVDAFGDRSNNTDSSATTVVGFGPPRPQISTTPQVPNASFKSAGAFAQGDFDLLDRVSLVLGARGQDIDARTRPATGSAQVSTNRAIVGTANVVYRLTSDVNLIASTGRGFRAPNLVERFFDGPTPEGSGYQKSSPGLRAETSLNVDLGARYRRGGTSLEGFVFRNTLHDGIRIATTGDSVNRVPAYRNVNVDRLKFSGVEASAQTLLGSSWIARASYTHLQSRDDIHPDNPIGHTYTTKTVGELSYRPAARWSATYVVRHNGRQSDGELGANPIGGVLPAFTVHAAYTSLRLLDRSGVRGSLRVAVDNIGNKLYAEAANVSFFRPQSGRSVTASWSLEF